MRISVILLTALGMAVLCAAQTVNTTCTLYPGAAYCTSTNTGVSIVEQQRQQYETGQAIGSGIGMAIFRAHFPGWRRKYCSTHPGQPFHYGNARGDSITGTCPTLQALASEAAAEFVAKHPGAVLSPVHAAAIDKYIGENNLPPWKPDSYEKAAKATVAAAQGSGVASTIATQPTQVSSTSQSQPPQIAVVNKPAAPQDLFLWFDEAAPTAGSPLFEVLVTAQAYDRALELLRAARNGDIAVRSGTNILDTDYHPASMSLESWRKANATSAQTLFYWQGEEVTGPTRVMHFHMTRRAYEQMLALMAGSGLRSVISTSSSTAPASQAETPLANDTPTWVAVRDNEIQVGPGEAQALYSPEPLAKLRVKIVSEKPVSIGLLDREVVEQRRDVVARTYFPTLDCGAANVTVTEVECTAPRYPHVLIVFVNKDAASKSSSRVRFTILQSK